MNKKDAVALISVALTEYFLIFSIRKSATQIAPKTIRTIQTAISYFKNLPNIFFFFSLYGCSLSGRLNFVEPNKTVDG